ncbi:MAG: hypothetical protein IJT95_06900, partial [Abditibacteriota bacterium]|nr:hypothetical protein [Abditibacteriota bacterium]
VGKTVRITSYPYFCRIGAVTEIPEEPETLATGAKARIIRVRLEDGQTVDVPRSNAEIIV